MIYVLIGIALFIGVGTCLLILNFLYNGFKYVPYVPTSQKISRQMVEAAELEDGQVVYDLGCGDGRLLRQAMKEKKVTAIGFEISRMVYWWGKLTQYFSEQKAKILRKNFFQEDISDADVVFCYLFPKMMEKLRFQFEKQLKPGAKVISHSFPIKAWKPVRTLQTRADKPQNFLIYIYEVPQSYVPA